MLVLTRKEGERIHVGDSVVITVVRIDRGKVRIGVEAPKSVIIAREELLAGGPPAPPETPEVPPQYGSTPRT